MEQDFILNVNSVLKRTHDNTVFRILFVNITGKSYWIDISGESNVPAAFNYAEVTSGIQSGIYMQIVDKWAVSSIGKQYNEKAIARQQRAWDLIKDVVQCIPEVYDPKTRSGLLKTVEQKTGVKATNIYNYLGRYWRGGMTPDTLYPDYSNCGKGNYIQNPEAKMPGRKIRPGATGKRLTTHDLTVFEAGIREFYLIKSKPSLNKAYAEITRKYYSTKKDADGNRLPLQPDEIPSFFQFRRWYYTKWEPTESEKKRNGEKHYDLNHRELLNKTISYVFGPCDAVQIDATIADDYVVRQDKRSAIAGRPTVYFVVDVVGSMVAGLYVTLDPPSWHGALMALMNCFEDKVEFCKRYGINITPDQWPCKFIPNRIIADRGEVESKVADILVNELGITIDNTVPYRGDFKGIVEQHFHVTYAELPCDRPGHVNSDFGERGSHDYRLDALLDIYQYTAMVIIQTLFYNNSHWMSTFIRTPEMRLHNIPSVPRDVWNHGLRYSTGVPRTLPVEKIRFAALPKQQATMDREGIHLNGLTYTCERAIKEHWFSNADITGTQKVTVSYNPTDAAFIYLAMEGTPVECHLVKYHDTYCGLHRSEIDAAFEDDKNAEAAYRINELNARHKMDDAIEKIIEDAKRLSPDVSSLSKAERLKAIQQNRSEERQACIDVNTRRSLETAGLLSAPANSEGNPDVHQSRTKEHTCAGTEGAEKNISGSDAARNSQMSPIEMTILGVLNDVLEEEKAK